jgi:hypothetical protein
MTLKYVQEHSDRPHAKPAPKADEIHVVDGEIYLGDKPTHLGAIEDFSFRKIILGVVATALFFVTDKLSIKI